MTKAKTLFLVPALLGLTLSLACAHGNCNNVPQRPTPTPSPSPSMNQEAPKAEKKTQPPENSVQVFKPTGEKQCSMGSTQSLEKMQSSLTHRKINVYDGHEQSDGLMHVALCGSPSGKIYVFTISAKSLKAAEKLGFKRWIEKNNP